MRYIVECLQLAGRYSRIEVRRSAQGVFNERVHLHRPSWQLAPAAFDLSVSGGRHEDAYDGPATLAAADTAERLRVSLAGHIEPIDGQYHWQGTVFGPISNGIRQARSVTVTVGRRCVQARITELTSQGTCSIAGVGEPPFPVPSLQLS